MYEAIKYHPQRLSQRGADGAADTLCTADPEKKARRLADHRTAKSGPRQWVLLFQVHEGKASGAAGLLHHGPESEGL